jgi:hypothetical protein
MRQNLFLETSILLSRQGARSVLDVRYKYIMVSYIKAAEETWIPSLWLYL